MQDPEDSHEAHKKKSKEEERRPAVSQWDVDVQPLISSAKWLQVHGLKRNKLSLSQILSQIGFQHRKGTWQINNKIIKETPTLNSLQGHTHFALYFTQRRFSHCLLSNANGGKGKRNLYPQLQTLPVQRTEELHLLLIWEGLRIWEGFPFSSVLLLYLGCSSNPL